MTTISDELRKLESEFIDLGQSKKKDKKKINFVLEVHIPKTFNGETCKAPLSCFSSAKLINHTKVQSIVAQKKVELIDSICKSTLRSGKSVKAQNSKIGEIYAEKNVVLESTEVKGEVISAKAIEISNSPHLFKRIDGEIITITNCAEVNHITGGKITLVNSNADSIFFREGLKLEQHSKVRMIRGCGEALLISSSSADTIIIHFETFQRALKDIKVTVSFSTVAKLIFQGSCRGLIKCINGSKIDEIAGNYKLVDSFENGNT